MISCSYLYLDCTIYYMSVGAYFTCIVYDLDALGVISNI